LEIDYQKQVLKNKPAFLQGALDYINHMETGNICEEIFRDGDGFKHKTVTVDNCHNFAGGIT
jgi:hypothetical protein